MRATLFFDHILLPGGWAENTRVAIEGGLITAITANAAAGPGEARYGVGTPGLPNLHSHTFQRAIAGLTEYAGGDDNFWSWREQMYRFGLTMSPDDVEAVATQAFVEMLEGGFTAVAEFHYLHHAPDGTPYADIAEMAGRIAAAADAAGIDLLLLPVFYAHANFGGLPPTPGQRRFICSLDDYVRLHEKCRALAPTGIAPHSLRAVTPAELAALLPLAGDRPVHLHISEQIQEVADCLAWCGARPIEWLLANAPVDERWCLIHATHADAAERHGMAAAGAVAGFCPITEANLGDGIFHMEDYRGGFGIGTDSNVFIEAPQELRQLEYTQRLAQRRRNVLATPQHPGTAAAMWQRAVAGGAQALGVPAGLRVGAPANIVSLVGNARPDIVLNTAVFAAQAAVDNVWVRGKQIVSGGRHAMRRAVLEKFDATLARLM